MDSKIFISRIDDVVLIIKSWCSNADVSRVNARVLIVDLEGDCIGCLLDTGIIESLVGYWEVVFLTCNCDSS